MALVQVLAVSSKDPTIKHLLRCLYYHLALFNVYLWAEHVLGVHNAVVDSISCNLMKVFWQLLPTVDHLGMPLPPSLTHLLSPDHQAWLLPT